MRSKIQFKIAELIMLCMLVAGIIASAQTLSDTITSTTVVDSDSIRDQSEYPNFNKRDGMLVFTVDIPEMPGAGATDVDISPALDDGIIIYDGFIEVHEALSPEPTNVALSVVSAGDLYANSTNTDWSVGFKDVVPASAASGIIIVTDSVTKVTYDITGTAAPTSGQFTVYLNVIQSNP